MEFDEIDTKLLKIFPGMIVQKDLAAKLQKAYAVPTYVLEFLLGRYCSTPNEDVINTGLQKVRETLEDHYLNPEKTEIIKSKIRDLGSFKILDRLKVRLVSSEDKYWGQLVGLNLDYVHIDEKLIKSNERMLMDGVWGISEIGYDSSLSRKGKVEPFILKAFQPVQISGDIATKVIALRKELTKDEWIQTLLRSIGLEPSKFTPRQQKLMFLRLVPFVERNCNMVEFGPRSTGKSFAFREISPHSLLISGGQTSIANLFASNVGTTGKPGLVSYYDVIAFDEVAGLSEFSNSQEIQIFKDYMESGNFSRGKGQFNGKASLVFIGNMNTDIQTALKTQHLFIPFPAEMQDLAFLDRFHIYLPGWELPRVKPEMFTGHFGFIVDIIAEFFQIIRNKSFYPQIDDKLRWGEDVDQRDKVRVRSVTSGLLKLIYPDGNFTLEDIQECAEMALECRRRVKEQLRRMGSVEYRETNLSYIIKATNEEVFVTTPEMELAKQYSPLSNITKSGIAFTIGLNDMERFSLYRIEVGLRKGRGSWNATGLAGKPIKDALTTVRDYIKANQKEIKPEITEHDIKSFDVHVQIVDLMQAHQGSQTGLGFFIAAVSKFLKIPIRPNTIIVGEMTISGALIPIQSLAEIILIGKECGADRILLPDNSQALLTDVPSDIKEGIGIEFFTSPIEAWELARSGELSLKLNPEVDEEEEVEQISEQEEAGKKSELEEAEEISKQQEVKQTSDQEEAEQISKQEEQRQEREQISEQPVEEHTIHEDTEVVSTKSITAEKKYDSLFILDGSNVARNKSNSKMAIIQDVVRCREKLISMGVPNEQIYIIFGAALRHYVPDEDKPIYETLITEKNVNQAPKGTDDDWFIINFAFQNNAFIITDDYYKEYKINHPEYREFINSHSIHYTCIGDQIMFEESFQERINLATARNRTT